MQDAEWRLFLRTARRLLGKGTPLSWGSDSWCAWTTFSSLESWLTYWHCGLPDVNELLETGTSDGGTWGQPFKYDDIAHFIIPATFYWEKVDGSEFHHGTKTQDIASLSAELTTLGIAHRKTDLVLEIKLY
ncbi:MAG: hypothetical protein ACXWIN_04830 [Burkholderiaceae bacterium]